MNMIPTFCRVGFSTFGHFVKFSMLVIVKKGLLQVFVGNGQTKGKTVIICRNLFLKRERQIWYRNDGLNLIEINMDFPGKGKQTKSPEKKLGVSGERGG